MRVTKRTPEMQRRMLDRGIYDPEEFEQWLSERRWGWQQLERGDYGMTVEESLMLFVWEDPVRWAEAWLVEPESQEPYRLFDYQKPSIRSYLQDVVHQDAAGVGKTREITVLTLWTCITGMGGRIRKPSMLIGAPLQVFLDDIFNAICAQAGVADGAEWKSPLRPFWLDPVRSPHKMLRIKCANSTNPAKPFISEVHFRPAGHDGEAFRGVHVFSLAIMEEAAKIKSKTCWDEFYRSVEPGCHVRTYSVHDGDRTSDYHRQTMEAIEDLPLGEPGTRKFNWTKPMMPAPFWSEERRRHFIKLFGGEDTSGYKRNVLGQAGDAEDPVFRWDVLLPNVVDLPDYRKLNIGADGGADLLYLEAHRVELVMTENRKSGREQLVADRAQSPDAFIGKGDSGRRAAWSELLAPHLTMIDPRGMFWIGCDLGERNDPTEIIVSEEVGLAMRDILRIKAKGLPYHAQAEMIYLIDRATGHRAMWGVDLGSAGTAVVKDLLNLDIYADANFEGRLIGFHFQESVDCLGEDGEPLEQEDTKGALQIVRAPAKHWSTLCIQQRLQGRGYQLAHDNDVLNDYTSHTARAGTKWPIYDKKNDHTIDARRMQMLRKLRANEGSSVDVFSVRGFSRAMA